MLRSKESKKEIKITKIAFAVYLDNSDLHFMQKKEENFIWCWNKLKKFSSWVAFINAGEEKKTRENAKMMIEMIN